MSRWLEWRLAVRWHAGRAWRALRAAGRQYAADTRTPFTDRERQGY